MKHRLIWAITVALAGAVILWLLLGETPSSVPPAGHAVAEPERAPPPSKQEETPRTIRRFRNTPHLAPVPPAIPALQGRVVTEADAPVPGAWVYAYQPETGAVPIPADHTGAFAFRVLPEGHFRLSARAAGYNEAVLESVSRGTSDVRLVLLPLSGVSGRVVEADTGLPIPQFDVICLDTVPTDDAYWLEITQADGDQWQTISNAGGNFVLRGVTSGKVVAIGVRAAGFAPAFVELGPLAPGEFFSPITIGLDRPAGIVIRAVDRWHRPIRGVSLHLGDDERGPVQGTTDSTGELRLEDLTPTPLLITATHPDFVTQTAQALPAYPPPQFEIALAQGGSIEGNVFRGDAAVPNALVVAGVLGHNGYQKKESTDIAGDFSIGGLPPGEAEVFVDLPQGEEADAPVSRLQKRVLLEDKAVTRVDFRFPTETSALEGTIRIGGRVPVSATLRGTILGDGGDSYFFAVSRTDGSYRAEGLLQGDAWIEVTATTASGAERRRNFELTIPEGALVHHDIEMAGEEVIAGTVVGLDEGETGEVLVLPPDISVDIKDLESLLTLQDLRSASAAVQPDGRFRAEGLEPGGYTLLAVVFHPDSPDETDVLSSLRLATEPVFLRAGKPANVTLDLRR